MPLQTGILDVFRLVTGLRSRGRSRASPGGRRSESGKNATKEEGGLRGKPGFPRTKITLQGHGENRLKKHAESAGSPLITPPASRRPSADFPGGLRYTWGRYWGREGRPPRGQHFEPRQALLS